MGWRVCLPKHLIVGMVTTGLEPYWAVSNLVLLNSTLCDQNVEEEPGKRRLVPPSVNH